MVLMPALSAVPKENLYFQPGLQSRTVFTGIARSSFRHWGRIIVSMVYLRR